MSSLKRYRAPLGDVSMVEDPNGQWIRIEDAPKALASKVTWKRMLAARRNGKMPCRTGKTRGRPKKKVLAKDTPPKA